MTPAPAIRDPDAEIRHLVAQATRRGYAIAFDLLGNRAEAEDAVQAALMRAIEWLPRLREPGAIDAWFYKTLANGCIRTLRRRRVALAFARLVGARGEPRAAPVDADHARLLAAVDRLPAMQKAAVVLRYGHDLGVDEIARVLDVGRETVKTHLERARTQLRKRMGVDR